MKGAMEMIRRQYGVPAKRGMAVKYDGALAWITSSTGSHLRLRFPEGSALNRYRRCTFHPLYKIDYLDGMDYRARYQERERAFLRALNPAPSDKETIP